VERGIIARAGSALRRCPLHWQRPGAAFLAALLGSSCLSSNGDGAPEQPLRVATSTSLEHSGMFAAVAEEFEQTTQRALTKAFVGTGRALALGRSGAADVVLVHSRVSEDAFVAEGYGINRRDVMYSEYVIVGPPNDPARIRGLESAVDAFHKLAGAKNQFVSRGDDSGNHDRERELWKLAGLEPQGPWYEPLDAGMWVTLKRASDSGAYALSDLPTYVVNRDKLRMSILVGGDERLKNRYAVIAVNPTRVSPVDYSGAMDFVDFLTSPAARALIGDFGRAEYGLPLFLPAGGMPSSE
jgi:tungstate transport system substrate-binding protein